MTLGLRLDKRRLINKLGKEEEIKDYWTHRETV
jgi:hypothetical protein